MDINRIESFVHGAAVENILQDILTAFNAGIHRCTVRNELGLTLAFTIPYVTSRRNSLSKMLLGF